MSLRELLTYLVLCNTFVKNGDTSSQLQSPSLSGLPVFIIIIRIVSSNARPIDIPYRLGKKSSKSCQPIGLLTNTLRVCNLQCCQLFREVGNSYVQFGCAKNITGKVWPVVYLHKQDCGVSKANLPEMVLVHVLHPMERVCGIIFIV